ncbi:MAG TPA: hydroxymethylbilane synthase [Candidatus Bathyarchaeia archaeon]|nr:hydroxymethylbilane synthase [Candidatus Bathyarchaeia archaeon]
MLLRVGTRGSKLSLVQTDQLIQRLRAVQPDVEVEKTVIATEGDKDRVTPLYFLGQKGIFEKEIDQAVLDGQVDFAVHSLKDLPVFDSENGLVIAAMPERDSPLDVLVSRSNMTLQQLPTASTVGTSSLLRVSQVRRLRPDLNPQPIRGNVETRIRKVDSGEFDSIILAEAGLERLGIQNRISELLRVEDFMPAPGQGIIAAVAKRNDIRVRRILSKIDHSPTRVESDAERELARILEGGCKVPIGALAYVHDNRIELRTSILSIDGTEKLEARRTGDVKEALGLAREAAEELIAQGAKRVEEGWKTLYA